jgi:hypothetical protein
MKISTISTFDSPPRSMTPASGDSQSFTETEWKEAEK